jgi:formylglycine-generating enzyme required for sulfatase activity
VRRYLNTICFLTAFALIVQAPAASATTTRGLKVVATDTASNAQAEVKLYDRSFAVIIGIDDYKHLPRDRQLKMAVRDAQGVEATLRKHYRFDQIVTLYNADATRDRILDLLTDELPRDMGENDALFVFWAGHGNQESSRTGDIGYLIPHDGDPKRLRTNITMTELRDTVSKKLPAKHVFYVMDACYSGLLTETRGIDKSPRRDLNYLKEITREPVRQVLTAGGKGEEVLDGGPNGHSVFTGRLIEVLEKTGDFITANEIQAILKEKVYGDARARNHTQTPAYGTLYGSGDFVFVPSLEQKVADNRAEIAKLQAEIAALDVADASAKAAASSAEHARRQREAESARKAAEGKLKAEQLKQQQLAEEEQRRRAEEAERQRLLAAKGEDDKKLAELKAAAELRRKAAGSNHAQGDFPTIESAIAEIKRLKQRIDSIEAGYAKELGATRKKIEQRYLQQLATLDAEQKDEFESSTAFKSRIEKQRGELQSKRSDELARHSVEQLAAGETAPLKQSIRTLAERRYTVGSEALLVELGAYDADAQRFSLSIKPRPAVKGQAAFPLKIAVVGTLPLPSVEARQFKQQWGAGLVRAEVTATPEGSVQAVQLVNDVDQSRRTWAENEFLTEAQVREREQERERERQEQAWRPEMLPIPAGSFEMGSRESGEKPVHRVSVHNFLMAKTEVTQSQWRAVMGHNPSRFVGCDDCPVESVSWDGVQEYLKKLNARTGKQYRLPSEAEWEYACRAGGSSEYCGRQDIDRLAWSSQNSGGKTHPVGQKLANAFGLHDMSGSVWEWVHDCWNASYAGAPNSGDAWTSGDCGRRVVRGGSWGYGPQYARSSNRLGYDSALRDSDFGFRIVLSPTTHN